MNTPPMQWQPSPVRTVATRIIEHALANKIVYPDDIDTTKIEDARRNCIGAAWNQLSKLGIIGLTKKFRNSRAPGAKNRRIFGYRIASKVKAEKFLTLNDAETRRDNDQIKLSL